MARQNMALFQRAASLLNPLAGPGTDGETGKGPATDVAAESAAASAAASAEARDTSVQIKELNERIEALQRQLGELIEVQQKR
jgi:hypothetical protein